ncbi:hypothetical protein [Bradyrhizobium sp. CCBAU 11445]|uniref:hypothetical protein n=1 Tax=Bradyrhizobium sp. CCBAU 11445 TaxID=1630896 RepID=UPI0023060A33|nr:hypothetical protein [Bradyrhizobium sp. CCBAU 11445]
MADAAHPSSEVKKIRKSIYREGKTSLRKTVSRRSILVGGVGLLAAPMVLRAARAAAKSDSVTFTGYGGSYQETLVNTVMNPFTEETGIKVNVVPIPDLAKVKAQLLTGNLEWDIYDGAGSKIEFGSKNGFWEKLDPSIFDLQDRRFRQRPITLLLVYMSPVLHGIQRNTVLESILPMLRNIST